MSVIEREVILKAAMEAGCDEAERLGYGSELGYAEAASIGEKAATVALDQLAGVIGALLPYLKHTGDCTGDYATGEFHCVCGLVATLTRQTKGNRMSVIEHTEKRITDLIGVAPHPGGDFYADILEVLQGRREQVETLRQQLAGAVETLREIAEGAESACAAGEAVMDAEWVAGTARGAPSGGKHD